VDATGAAKIYRESVGRCLYVAGTPGHYLVKIGIADCPRLRIETLRRNSDETLIPHDVDRSMIQVLYQQRGGRRLELALHRRLRHRRVLGEWFDLGPIAVPLIKSLIREVDAA